jgi:quercetin dioxygenase-like cupin family protein
VTAAQPTLQIDNDRVRVTEWRFAPGTETGWHKHGMDYVVVPLYDGTLRIETADGATDVELHRGVSYARLAGAEHNVISTTLTEFAFVEIELKDDASPAPR